MYVWRSELYCILFYGPLVVYIDLINGAWEDILKSYIWGEQRGENMSEVDTWNAKVCLILPVDSSSVC